jgi:hypothetical protein
MGALPWTLALGIKKQSEGKPDKNEVKSGGNLWGLPTRSTFQREAILQRDKA